MIDLGQQQPNYNIPVPRVQMPQVPQMPFMAQPEKVAPLGEMIFVDTKEQLQGVNIPANSQRVFFSKTMQGFNGIQRDLCAGFGSVTAGLTQLGYQQQQCCCELKGAIHAEGEATRALITENIIQGLREKIVAKDQELQTANFQLSQQAQSAALISALRPVPIPAYLTASPYTTGYNGGCCGAV